VAGGSALTVAMAPAALAAQEAFMVAEVCSASMRAAHPSAAAVCIGV